MTDTDQSTDLFATYRAKPVRAVQLTAENIDVLAQLDGIRYEPETADVEMVFAVAVSSNSSQGIAFGDWIVETATTGIWSIGWVEDIGVADDFPVFETAYDLDTPIDPVAAEAALRELIKDIDYDTYKYIEHDEEDGSDGFPDVVTKFIAFYAEAASK